MFSDAILTKRVVEKRITNTEAAKEIGISKATLSRIERQSTPDVYTYFYVCKWLGSKMEDYFQD